LRKTISLGKYSFSNTDISVISMLQIDQLTNGDEFRRFWNMILLKAFTFEKRTLYYKNIWASVGENVFGKNNSRNLFEENVKTELLWDLNSDRLCFCHRKIALEKLRIASR
jgi:hypothetical protein